MQGMALVIPGPLWSLRPKHQASLAPSGLPEGRILWIHKERATCKAPCRAGLDRSFIVVVCCFQTDSLYVGQAGLELTEHLLLRLKVCAISPSKSLVCMCVGTLWNACRVWKQLCGVCFLRYPSTSPCKAWLPQGSTSLGLAGRCSS